MNRGRRDCACGGTCRCHVSDQPCDPAIHPAGCGHVSPGERRAEDTGPHCGRRCAVATNGVVCQPCSDHALLDLTGDRLPADDPDQHAGLPELYVLMWSRLPRSEEPGRYHERVGGSKERPLPINEDIHDHMAEIVKTLVRWADQIAVERPLHGYALPPTRRTGRWIGTTKGLLVPDRGPDRDLDAARVAAIATWLPPHHDWATRQAWGVDYAEQLRELAHAARIHTRSYPIDTRVIGPRVTCPECATPSLLQDAGSPDVYCANCATVLGPDEFGAREQECVDRAAPGILAEAMRDAGRAMLHQPGLRRVGGRYLRAADRADARLAAHARVA